MRSLQIGLQDDTDVEYDPKLEINNTYSNEDGGKMSETAEANYYYYTLSITLQHWYYTLIVSF